MNWRLSLCLFCSLPLCAETAAEALAASMLARVQSARWNSVYTAPLTPASSLMCQPWIAKGSPPTWATDQWSYHCTERGASLLVESFFYVFAEVGPPRALRLRVDVQPEGAPKDVQAEVMRLLTQKLTARYGVADREPEMMEIGFRRSRYGQPPEGLHWRSGALHFFLHSNQSHQEPLGIRTGVQLIAMTQRLAEHNTDRILEQVEGRGGSDAPDEVRSRLIRGLGERYEHAMRPAFTFKTDAERTEATGQVEAVALDLLRAAQSAPRERKALLLAGADDLAVQLSLMVEPADIYRVRRKLAGFGVKLGEMTHYAGWDYRRDLLWRVWRELPETEGGEIAFLRLQRMGWNTFANPGCPQNPDLFREVIRKGEEFLTKHPATSFRKEVLYTLALANESWWSIAQAADDDIIISAPPYPRRDANKQAAKAALHWAIHYYREILKVAPGSPEALAAERRLPRLELGLDTGQRAFFCSFC